MEIKPKKRRLLVVLSMGAIAGWTLKEYSEVETIAANSLPNPEQ